jgi:hypothetical protein
LYKNVPEVCGVGKKNKGKLIIAVYSGLGNQMFHYAFYKYLKLAGFNVFLDKNSPASKSQHQKHETFRLDYFQLRDLKFATEDDVIEFIPKIKDVYLKPFSMILKTESVVTVFKTFFYKLLNKLRLNHKKSHYWVEWEKTGKGKEFYRKNLSENTRAYMVGRYQECYYLQGMREQFRFNSCAKRGLYRHQRI